MRKYEKQSFIKIFFGYFISVSIFILLLGYLYYQQQKVHILQKTASNMHQYILTQRQSKFTYEQEGYRFDLLDYISIKHELPIKEDDEYYKAFTNSVVVYIDAKIVDDELYNLKFFTIILQISLILFFAVVSYLLTKRSLKPMVEAFNHLDNFTKDLIHDLNTPITSIFLNLKLLKKNASDDTLNKLKRIENASSNISSLYANLEILLKEKNLQKEQVNLSNIIQELIEIYSLLYPKIKFDFNNTDINIYSDKYAIKRVLDNIISNACKYSKDKDASINISFDNNILKIQDNGKGIKYPNKIFQRNYKEYDKGYGIGMHIVQRICNELNHKITIQSKENIGTTIEISLNSV